MIRRAALIFAIVLSFPVAVFAQDMPASADSREHTVVAGETLWSIARQYYGSPFEWRRIFEANQPAVANEHWIEPGQRLTIPGAATSMAVATGPGPTPVRTTPRETSRPIQVVQSPERAPGRTVFYPRSASESSAGAERVAPSSQDVVALLRAVPHDVFYSAGWLIGEEAVPDDIMGRVLDFADDQEGRVRRVSVMPFERVRVEIDGALPQVGEQMLVVRRGRRIKDIGDVVIPTGILTVSRQEEPGVVAVLANEYDRVKLGDWVVPLPALNLEPGIVAQPATSDLAAQIVTFQVNKEVQSLGDIAYLSIGLGEGVRIGDEFLVYADDTAGWKGDVIGRIQVVGVRADQSIARIVDVEAPLFAEGLKVQLVARMP